MNVLNHRALGFSLVAALASTACVILPDPLYDGRRWENTATGATGEKGSTTVFIINSEGEPVHEGECICNSDHALMLSVAEGITDPVPKTDDIAESIATRTVIACEDAADVLGLDPGTNDCEATVATDGFPHHVGSCSIFAESGVCGPVDLGDTGGESDDTGGSDEVETESTTGPVSPFDDLSSHVTCTSATACQVTQALVDAAIADAEELVLDGAVVQEVRDASANATGYEFTVLPTGSLADLLGFQLNDKVTEIDGVSVADPADWFQILGDLVGATSVDVTYERELTTGVQTTTVTITVTSS